MLQMQRHKKSRQMHEFVLYSVHDSSDRSSSVSVHNKFGELRQRRSTQINHNHNHGSLCSYAGMFDKKINLKDDDQRHH